MTDSTIKTAREILGRADYRQMALENRLLRSILGDLIVLTEDWYYGPMFSVRPIYGGSEPAPLLRAKAFLCGDRRRAAWVKVGVLAQMKIRRKLRAMPHKMIHAISGLWILGLGLAAMGIGGNTGWWEPETAASTLFAAFGGYMVGGAAMFARIIYRRLGIDM